MKVTFYVFICREWKFHWWQRFSGVLQRCHTPGNCFSTFCLLCKNRVFSLRMLSSNCFKVVKMFGISSNREWFANLKACKHYFMYRLRKCLYPPVKRQWWQTGMFDFLHRYISSCYSLSSIRLDRPRLLMTASCVRSVRPMEPFWVKYTLLNNLQDFLAVRLVWNTEGEMESWVTVWWETVSWPPDLTTSEIDIFSSVFLTFTWLLSHTTIVNCCGVDKSAQIQLWSI